MSTRLLVTNARVHTMDPAVPGAEAFLVEDGRIADIGRADAVRNRAAGAATLLGSNLLDFTSESNVAWDVTMAASGNNVEIRVTGVAATTIDWTATVEYQAVSTNA